MHSSAPLQDERARVKEQQDGAYHRLQAVKQQSRGKKDAYYQNRRFSQEVLCRCILQLGAASCTPFLQVNTSLFVLSMLTVIVCLLIACSTQDEGFYAICITLCKGA